MMRLPIAFAFILFAVIFFGNEYLVRQNIIMQVTSNRIMVGTFLALFILLLTINGLAW